MKDLRKQSLNNSVLRGNNILASGYSVDENTVTEMLMNMGVDPTPDMVQGAIGYCSTHGMELNMNNLGDFLKSKQIISRVDLRNRTTRG